MRYVFTLSLIILTEDHWKAFYIVHSTDGSTWMVGHLLLAVLLSKRIACLERSICWMPEPRKPDILWLPRWSTTFWFVTNPDLCRIAVYCMVDYSFCYLHLRMGGKSCFSISTYELGICVCSIHACHEGDMQVAILLLKHIIWKAWYQQYWAGYKVSII